MAEKRGYHQFCPLALAAEVVAERWTPLVIRELLCGSHRFSDLQRGLPRMSSALLARRLKELEAAGIVQRRAGLGRGVEYHLSDSGRELLPVIEGMGVWAQRWLRHNLVNDANLDPDLLMWDIRRIVARHAPDRGGRFVVQFELSGAGSGGGRRYWLMFDGGQVDLCKKDPGFDVNVFVEASLRLLTQIWLGHVSIDQALGGRQLRLHGSKRDLPAFRACFALSLFAPAGRKPAPETVP